MEGIVNIVQIRGKLSNFGLTPYTYQGMEFQTSEHHYQYLKAMFFDDAKTANLIQSVPSPKDAKTLSRAIVGYDETRWYAVRAMLMYEAVRAKFTCNKAMRDLLLSYPIDSVFVEYSDWDDFWGVKRRSTSKLPKTSAGQNVLGIIMSRVRHEIEPLPQPNLFSQYEDNL